ncbi:MAG: SAM-dependent methyltransferase, partial [Kiritimatiellae bacterium]|nr:SAM-dependent methyltransferase [Kiritimatiellia bacterium]
CAGSCPGPAAAGHDRAKDYPLSRFDSSALMLALGFSAPGGGVKPSMQAKFRQVNQFLSLLDAAIDELPARKGADAPFCIVDCGCGKAYLSFAAKAYLEASRGMKVRLCGVDRKEQVVAFCRRTAETLGWDADGASFALADIAAYEPPAAPDAVLSLHAYDTATDEAIAFGIERGARAILSAPCCQHELQKSLDPGLHPHQAVLRNNILRERLADILTDAFRAQILRVAGYRASVVEFVEPEATARNVMIRAVRVSRPGAGTALADYADLRSA